IGREPEHQAKDIVLKRNDDALGLGDTVLVVQGIAHDQWIFFWLETVAVPNGT
ncbi:hypothetical protein BBJ29_001079, partial [Phytophthora kernoviae]